MKLGLVRPSRPVVLFALGGAVLAASLQGVTEAKGAVPAGKPAVRAGGRPVRAGAAALPGSRPAARPPAASAAARPPVPGKAPAVRPGPLAGRPAPAAALPVRNPLGLLTDFSGFSDADAELLRTALVTLAQKSRYDVLARAELEAGGEPLPAISFCFDSASCQEELAGRKSVRYLLSTRAAVQGGDVSLLTRLFDAQVGHFAADAEELCSPCTAAQAATRLSAQAAQVIRRGTTRSTGILEITSEPAGGEVLVDGRKLGTTPFRRLSFDGEHDVVVHKTGFFDYQNSVIVDPGRGAALDAVLRPDGPDPRAQQPEPAARGATAAATPARSAAPAAPAARAPADTPRPPAAAPQAVAAAAPAPIQRPARRPRPRWRIAVGVIGAVAGATLLGFGIGGLLTDGKCTVATVPVGGGELCPSGRVASTLGLGAGLTAAGALLLGGGVALAAVPGARVPEPPAPTPTPEATAPPAPAAASPVPPPATAEDGAPRALGSL